MSKIRGIIISLIAFVFSIFLVKADPVNYILKFGVDGNAECCDCRHKLSEITSRLFKTEKWDVYTFFWFNRKTCIIGGYEHNYLGNMQKHFSVQTITPGQRSSVDEFWHGTHAFIDLNENPRKYRCIECMTKYANNHYVSKQEILDFASRFESREIVTTSTYDFWNLNDKFLKCRLDFPPSVPNASKQSLEKVLSLFGKTTDDLVAGEPDYSSKLNPIKYAFIRVIN